MVLQPYRDAPSAAGTRVYCASFVVALPVGYTFTSSAASGDIRETAQTIARYNAVFADIFRHYDGPDDPPGFEPDDYPLH